MIVVETAKDINIYFKSRQNMVIWYVYVNKRGRKRTVVMLMQG